MNRRRSATRAAPWSPKVPVPWPVTGSLHLDILRAAIEQRLYPYGDLESSPGRVAGGHQLRLLERGRKHGMTDAEVSAFLSANLACGLTPVCANRGFQPERRGSVVFAGGYHPRDAMGRSTFYWTAVVTPAHAPECDRDPQQWEGPELARMFRHAFGVPYLAGAEPQPEILWDSTGQAALF